MNEVLNSCLMWAINLDTPVDFSAVIDDADLFNTGIELDSHITLLYAQGKEIKKDNILTDIQDILGEDYKGFLDLCKDGNDSNVFALFDLDVFENDSDYLVLKLKNDSELFDMSNLINKGLRVKYSVNPDFKYTPHITLAELKPGTARKYLTSETLKLILDDSFVGFEDLVMSYGTDNDVKDRKQYNLTSYKCLERYFRLQDLEKYNQELR